MRLLGLVFAACISFGAGPAYAHGGGLNHCGCHINHSTGECHCHRDYGACDCACRPVSCGGNTSCATAEPGPLRLEPVSEVHGRGAVSVRSHTTKSGTYVAPHMRSAPDHSKTNNWSAKGNTNPYTGKRGTRTVK